MKRILIKLCLSMLLVVQNILSLFIKHHAPDIRSDDFSHSWFLIIKLWAIGEVVLTTPLVKALKKRFPSCTIVYLTGARSAPVLENNKYIDRIISVEESVFLKFRLFRIRKLVKDLRKLNFDVILNLHHFIGFHWFACLTRVGNRIGFNRNHEGELNTIKIAPSPEKHKIDEYLTLLEPFDIKKAETRPYIELSSEERSFSEEYFKMEGITRKDILVGLMPTGSGNLASSALNTDINRKVWPIGNYIRLAELLIKEPGVKVIFFGGEREVLFREKISVLPEARYIDTIGELTLRQLVSISKNCEYVVTNDSGPMHLLGAAGVKLFAIFGPTDFNLCGPGISDSVIIHQNLDCSPCFRGDLFPNFEPSCTHIDCMNLIQPEDVLAYIRKSGFGKKKK